MKIDKNGDELVSSVIKRALDSGENFDCNEFYQLVLMSRHIDDKTPHATLYRRVTSAIDYLWNSGYMQRSKTLMLDTNVTSSQSKFMYFK